MAAETEPTSADPLLGRELDGRYRIEGRLGEGGLGVVYRARHVRLGRAFAIKVLQPVYASNASLRARFDREAKALGALNHPGVVGVTDFGIDGEVPFLVMELLEGATLDVRMPLPPDRALSILRDVLGAVAYAHGLGLVHRDLKPANVFLESLPEGQERVRVLDFGLAKFLDGSDGSALTRPGATLGTPAYMSPEQALGGAASPRNDVYALGILLYELLVHERPFRGESGELMRQHLLVPVPSLASKRPDLPSLNALDAVVQRATAKAPAERFEDAAEMRTALDQALGRTSGAYPASSVSRSGATALASVTQEAPKKQAPAEPARADATVPRGPRRAPVVDEVGQTVLAIGTSGGSAAAASASASGPATAPSANAAATSLDGPKGPVASAALPSLAGPNATSKDEIPQPRMPRSRPPERSPVASAKSTPPPRSSGAAVGVVLGLVLLLALGAVAFFVLPLFGVPVDPLASVRSGVESGAGAVNSAVNGAVSDAVNELLPEAGPGEVRRTDGPGAVPPVTVPVSGSVSGASEPPAPPATGFSERDPWLEPVPSELARIRARVSAGEAIGDGARATLRLAARNLPEDPRPWLLMGHADFAAGARTDAMDRYEHALEVSPSARFDPAMLGNLLVMSAHRTVGARAQELVVSIYGRSALAGLREIRVRLEDTEEIERLDALEERLLSVAP